MPPPALTAGRAVPALTQLADFAAGISIERLPAPVVAKAKLCLVDTLSACVDLANQRQARVALAMAARYDCRGGVQIFGSTAQCPPPLAAFVNGTSAAGTARSDTHEASATHPGSVVIPAAMAVAQAQRLPGSSLIAAVVAGYEIACRLGSALVTPQVATMFRPTGLIGPVGAACAAAKALGLGSVGIAHAAGLAAHAGAGLMEWSRAGTSEHVFHSGAAARSGIESAWMAELGAACSPTMLDGMSGLLAAFGAQERAGRLTEGLETAFRTLEIEHKPAPACIYAQVPAQLAQRLLREHGLRAADVATVEIAVPAEAAAYPGCDNPGPIASQQAARMSIQFAVAATIVHAGIEDGNWRDYAHAAANTLAARCTVSISPADTAARDSKYSITAATHGGQRISLAQREMTAMSEADVHRRFLTAASPVLGPERAEHALALIAGLETLDDTSQLGDALRALPGAGDPAAMAAAGFDDEVLS